MTVFVGTDSAKTRRELTVGGARYAYYSIEAAGAAPGRVVRAEAHEDKPPRIEAEGWQTSLPVITEPEAFAILHTIS